MMKELKIISVLMVSGLLFACGAAKDSTSDDEPNIIDNSVPVIEKIIPNIVLSNSGKTLIPIDTKRIVFTFNEALDPSIVEALGTQGFISSDGAELKGTWSYNTAIFELTFTFDFSSLGQNITQLPNDATFTFRFNPNILKDLAGNGLSLDVIFNTPQSYDVQIFTAGLPDGSSIEVRVEDQSNVQNSVNHTITANDSSLAAAAFSNGTEFTLSVNTQPDADVFCAFASSSGKITENDANVQLNCSNVVPYVSESPDWNDYYSSEGTILHGGEHRKFAMSNLQNCDNLVITDDLGAFDWSCAIDNSDVNAPLTIIRSTGLKQGKNLSDLLNISRTNPSWKQNSVSVKQNDIELNQNKVAAVWWNNPVRIPKQANLSEFETIYVIPDNETDVARNYSITERHISFVTHPDIVWNSDNFGTAAIEVVSTGIWIEANIDANNSTNGIYVNNGYYTQIRNSSVSYASGDGINITNSESTYITNAESSFNGANGIKITGNSSLFTSVILGNEVKNVVVNNNVGNGIYVDSISNDLVNITATNNDLDGIFLQSVNNLSHSVTSNNGENGLTIGGHNNIVTMLTADANTDAGVRFSKITIVEPQKNILSNTTTSNNIEAGIAFDTDLGNNNATTEEIITSNTLTNNLEVFNGVDLCAVDAICDVDAAGKDLNTSSDVLIDHAFKSDTTDIISFLENAYEDLNSSTGNLNGICENGETCVFTPNAGHYQGQGALAPVSPPTTVVTEEGITLNEFSENGR